jgi:DNA-directed RNA polymerase specialized sigma subunit
VKRNDILLFIYNSKSIKSSAKRITKGDDLYNDLISELLIILSDMDLNYLITLYNKNILEIYCYKIMYYQYTQPHMAFYKKYRSFESTTVEMYTNDENIDEIYDEVVYVINKIEKKVSQKRFPTEFKLLELYVEHGTYRKVGALVDISFKTVHYMVKNLIEKIKKEYDLSCNK